MLKLVDFVFVIFDVLVEDCIIIEYCQVLVLENDIVCQVQVFEVVCQLGWGGKLDVWVICNLIMESEVVVKDNIKFCFVGVDVFLFDELCIDLFSDDEGGYVDCVVFDVVLLEKFQVVVEYFWEVEGWEWCVGCMEFVGECCEDFWVYCNLLELEVVLMEVEEECLNELMMCYDVLENQCEEFDLLVVEMKLIDCMVKVRVWMLEMCVGSGVVVFWCYGNVCVQCGVQLCSEDDVIDDVDCMEQVQEKVLVEEISLLLLMKMFLECMLVVQVVLM